MPQATVLAVGKDDANLSIEREILSEANIAIRGVSAKSVESMIPREVLDADGILHSGWRIDRQVIKALRRCRVIGRYGLGYDNIDVEAATERGIAVVTARGYCDEEIPDHVLAFMLSWFRQIPFYDRAARAGSLRVIADPIPRISTLTAGLCGFGQIARNLTPKLKALGMRVLAYDPYAPDEAITALGAERTDFDGLLNESDVISIHCALTDETHHLFDAPAFRKIKSSAVIINTARGGIIDTGALVRALQNGELAGACLDVLETGAFEEYALHQIENLLLTPHMAWRSETARVELARRAATNVRAVLEGRKPDGLINPDVISSLNLVG